MRFRSSPPGKNISSAKVDEPAATLSDRAVPCCAWVAARPACRCTGTLWKKPVAAFCTTTAVSKKAKPASTPTMAAAGLVICQTGCISHGAYRRVKDHCQRHGKPCVFVENPGSASLRRALAEFQPVTST